MEISPSWTKAGIWTLGRDPLGMQATSVRLYRTLVPGLTNVTNRLRYYSFYCWVIQHYETTEHSGDDTKWRIFIRRAEAVYALACNFVDPHESDGMAGGNWAKRQSLETGIIDLRPHTDNPGQSDQYLKALRGNFGQFYIASMTEVGLLAPSGRIPIVTDPLGRNLANAFADSIGNTCNLIANAIRDGRVTDTDLVQIGHVAHPSRIPLASEEMATLRRYLTGTGDFEKNGSARRASAWIILDLLHRGVTAQDEIYIRDAFYNRRLPDGSPYGVSGPFIDKWKAFQANEFCHIAFEAILNGLLAELRDVPFGLEPSTLIKNFLRPRLTELSATDDSWQDWATKLGSSLSGSENSLADDILSNLSDMKNVSDVNGITSSLQMIATLWHLWGEEHSPIRDMIELYAGRGGRSLSGVLRTLNTHASKSVEDALLLTIRRHLIADHLTIAGRKLAASGTFTYHFTLTDGVISDGRLSTYGYTNPRIRNLIRFIRDAGFYDGSIVTDAGMEFLRENRPV